MMKKLLAGILATAFLLGVVGASHAKREGFCPRAPHFASFLSKEQMEKMNALRENFRKETESLRKEILEKRAELRKMYADPKVSDDQIRKKQKELSALREKMREKRLELRLEQRKILTPEQLARLGEAKRGRFGKGKHMGL